MTLFVVSVVTVVVVSAMCSLSEASIYAVRQPFIRTLVEADSAAGRVLDGFKNNMERPIAAILIVNTAANTAGAAVAGAQASGLFGPNALLWFSAFFTLTVLMVSEIFPKVLGVAYSRTVARSVAVPWGLVIKVLSPLIWMVEHLSVWLKPSGPVFAAPEDEVVQLAQISANEGSISAEEAEWVRNALALNDRTAGDVMTPRPVVFRLPDDITVGQVGEYVDHWTHSRIPTYDPADPDRWVGLVRSADVLGAMAAGRHDTPLKELCRPLLFVPDSTPGHVLLQRFITERSHLIAVLDEFGGMAGVVTLEDVIESLLGREILDETDRTADLREEARTRARERIRRGESASEVDEPESP